MDSKDKWISEVENSLNGLRAAEENPFLYTKIQGRLENIKKASSPARLVWLTTISLVILVLLNITVIKTLPSQPKSDRSVIQTMSDQMQLMNINTINYN